MGIKKRTFTIIKILSIHLIGGAVGLELWHLYMVLANNNIFNIPSWMVGLERFAVAIHLLEGGVAAAYAPSKNKPAFRYGIYTFFVGTVGLVELFAQKAETAN